ncbi:hypothetical protein [Paenibacillus piri]|uniref:Uncharacterized protein n=1 Tax=Paenibacillus piri TaxID=2547395 RepID=A0A4R5K816_9BACL|nr:hypothetical protein [Paenibacillus piri]TDF91029.1 hypothetical protein E1757_33560 [Paenibacillus piri]
MKAGYELIEDNDFETAKKNGYIVKVTQGAIAIYPPGKVTAYSENHVAIDGKKVFRPVNKFHIAE